MSDLKRPLGIDVLTAARQRIADVFDNFPRVVVSFSAGKDSTVLLHLVGDEARRRGRRFGLLLIDWEAQFRLTIEHAEAMFAEYADCSDPYWVAIPLKTTNAVSQIEPEWTCWDGTREDAWVRTPPDDAITSPSRFSFAYDGMTFEEFVEHFGAWYSGGELTACLVGLRAAESLNRFRAVFADRSRFMGRKWTTYKGKTVYNAYPIYDWKAEDIWTYHAKHPERSYNRLYDLMHKAGLSVHQMRVCEPYGDEQRKGLWLYHLIEPETWGKVASRVAGANSGALYAGESGNILGNMRIDKPNGHSWKSYAAYLLDTMPPPTAEHYRNKIAVYVNYCIAKCGYHGDLPDEADGDTGGKDVPSWRRICKTLLRNDYWCKGLSFSPTKAASYERYRKVMRNRRAKWGLI